MVVYEEMSNRVAIVTGGGSGCGKAITKALVDQGCKVAIFGNNWSNCEKTAQEFRDNETGAKVFPVFSDVASRSDVQIAIGKVVERFGRIDYLVNNAGISEVDFIPNIKEHHWDRIMNVNAKGTFLMTQTVANYWIKNKKKGNIVNIVSESCFSYHTMCMSYNASKAAQNAISKTSARELIKYGIRVNAVHPSIVEGTALTAYLNEQFKKEYGWDEETAKKMYLSKIPAGRFCKKEDIAKAVLWLLSNESEFVIGNDLLVSGGQSI